MVKVVLFLASGFEEIEAMSIVDTLRRAGVEVVVAGLQEGATEGSRGVNVIPNRSIDEIALEEFAAVILPGGSPGYINLGRDRRVLDLVTRAFEEGRIVAAICGAPTVLADLGILKGKKATVCPGKEAELTGAEFVNERVVVDGAVVTSQGPGTAIEFGITLIELLVGKQRAQEVKDDLVANF
ncbi:MAG TPA: DJ-1 family glyoxalase III [Desulfobacteria bacterium]|nr:DJ-1 family glyoxalase III [Desulfobacteria bacterium]